MDAPADCPALRLAAGSLRSIVCAWSWTKWWYCYRDFSVPKGCWVNCIVTLSQPELLERQKLWSAFLIP